MGTLTITDTWSTGATPTEADIDGIKDSIERFLNETGISDDNLLTGNNTLDADKVIKDLTISGPKFADSAITRAKQAARNIIEAGDSYATETVTSTASGGANVGSSASITTTGRPVLVFMNSVGGTTNDNYLQYETSNGTDEAEIWLLRDTTEIARWAVRSDDAATSIMRIPLCSLMFFDTPAAGTYAYQFKANVPNASDTLTFKGNDTTAVEW